MKILVSGSHGLVGKALIKSVTTDGIEVSRLVRRKPTGATREIEWHPDEGLLDAKQLEGLDAVVHLAGESIASGRWSDEKKRAIRESRVKGTQLLSRSLAQLSQPPASFISASAIGYYGNRGDELLTEESASGNGFLASVCMEWEKSTAAAAEKGIRTVNTRFGIILDASGGALEKMLTPFRMGIGGRIGNGKQWMSWITLDDVVGGLRFVLNNSAVSGPVNFVAPNPVTNAAFTKALGRALSRPTFFPIPKIGVQLAFGEMGDALLLSSQRVEPRVLKGSGYRFQLPNLSDALTHVLK